MTGPTPHPEAFAGRIRDIQRRSFLRRSGTGLGAIVLAALFGRRTAGADTQEDAPALPRWQGVLGAPQGIPRARRVIHDIEYDRVQQRGLGKPEVRR